MTLGKIDGTVKSPCVRNCCLDDDDVCIGCFRSLDEILQWNASTQEEKKDVLIRCNNRKEKSQIGRL